MCHCPRSERTVFELTESGNDQRLAAISTPQPHPTITNIEWRDPKILACATESTVR
jgi:hypothetical protein